MILANSASMHRIIISIIIKCLLIQYIPESIDSRSNSNCIFLAAIATTVFLEL